MLGGKKLLYMFQLFSLLLNDHPNCYKYFLRMVFLSHESTQQRAEKHPGLVQSTLFHLGSLDKVVQQKLFSAPQPGAWRLTLITPSQNKIRIQTWDLLPMYIIFQVHGQNYVSVKKTDYLSNYLVLDTIPMFSMMFSVVSQYIVSEKTLGYL